MPPALVAFDMEGCLTADPTVWEIMHRKLDTWESHGLPYWNRYRAGEFHYDEFARMDVAVWRGAPTKTFSQAVSEVAFMPGCVELLGALIAAGVQIAIISNGLAAVAERFRLHGVAHIHANDIICAHGRLTGEIDLRIPYDNKGEVLRRLAGQLGVSREQIASVGDSSSDIAMFRESRVSVAFRAGSPAVAAAATHVVHAADLRELLPILLASPDSRT